MEFSLGEFVRKRNNPGKSGSVAGEVIEDAGDRLWPVRLPNGTVTKWMEGTFEAVPTRENIFDLLQQGSYGKKTDFSQAITFHRLVRPLANHIYSLHSNRIEFLPYQFKPLLKFLDSPRQRLLVADDVGLGKTIEAGIILSELRIQSPRQSVMIVCPSHLRDKWRFEMRNKFGEEFEILDSKGLCQWLADQREMPGLATARIICSLQMIRAVKIQEAFEHADPRFDVVIVDEAHHMRNRETLHHKVGELLSRQSEAMVMLTATPLHTKLENLFQLLHILDPDQFQRADDFESQIQANTLVLQAERALAEQPIDLDVFRNAISGIENLPRTQREWFVENPLWQPLAAMANRNNFEKKDVAEARFHLAEINLLGDHMTRTRKVDARTEFAQREPQVLKIRYSPEERQIYDFILEYVRKRYPMGGTFFEKAAMMMPQRRAASSIIGAAQFYGSGKGEIDLDEYLAGVDTDYADWYNGESPVETADIRTVFDSAFKGEVPDTKYEALIGYLASIDPLDKVVLFSTFPSTLHYLQGSLQRDGVDSRVISGQVHPEDRLRRIQEFKEKDEVRVLLSSEVGGEGLDMQFACIIVNYDMPWNPMVVAQRIGRLDRIGQKAEKIRIINICVEDTIDEVILERLYNRIGLFEASIGLMDGILGDVLREITDALLAPDLTHEQRLTKLDQESQAVENNLKMMQQLKDNAYSTVIGDHFMQERVEQADALHRYVGPEELKILISDFFLKHYPKTVLQGVKGLQNVFSIDADTTLRADFAHFPFRPGEHRPAFLDRSGDLHRVTFSTEVATAIPTVEHITASHPLTRFVISRYRDEGDPFHCASCFRTSSRIVSPGVYLVLVWKLMAEGCRPVSQLIQTVVHVGEMKRVSGSKAELFLTELVEKGRDHPHLVVNENGTGLLEAYRIAERYLKDHTSEIREAQRKRDDAYRSRRSGSQRAYYNRRIRRYEELVEEHVQSGSPSPQIKGFQTRVETIRAERDEVLYKIESGSPFDFESAEILAAVVTVEETDDVR